MNKKLNDLSILCFNVSNVNLGIYLKFIEKIVFLPMVTAIPNSPNFVVGIVNYMGNSIYIYDLAMLLGIRRDKPYTIDTNVLICNVKDNHFGLIIDKIEKQVSIIESQVQCKDEFYDEKGLISSVVLIRDKQRLLLDANKIIQVTHKSISDISNTLLTNQGSANG